MGTEKGEDDGRQEGKGEVERVVVAGRDGGREGRGRERVKVKGEKDRKGEIKGETE